MKLIKLTRESDRSVLINTMTITALVDLGPVDKLFNTQVYTMGGSHIVKETIEEIQKLIKETEKTTTITWQTGPR
jgi:hypothetical protein